MSRKNASRKTAFVYRYVWPLRGKAKTDERMTEKAMGKLRRRTPESLTEQL